MIKKTAIQINKVIRVLSEMLRVQELRAKELEGLENAIIKKSVSSNGTAHYSFRRNKGSKYEYLGTADNPELNKIKEAHYLKLSRQIIRKNLKAFTALLKEIESIDYDSVNSRMPELYRGAELNLARHISSHSDNNTSSTIRDAASKMSADERCRIWKQKAEAYKARFAPYRPEDLKYKTVDGSKVRSYSEVVIYNLLVSLGITFVYELPLVTNNKRFLPDFTILSERDYSTTIIIEHQGMMSDPKYRDRFRDKVYDYLRAGYVQGINIFYTFDLNDSGIDVDPVIDLIHLHIRPKD